MARRRKRHHDKTTAGPSAIVRYRHGESPGCRHYRRLQTNLAAAANVEEWCREHGIVFRVSNKGHHWTFRRGRTVVEWWPSSAKLVVNKRWKDGSHVHDWKQAQTLVLQAFGLSNNQET